MIIELHIIQNFAPSNLNRDDTGSPKSCEFGGYRRARISSQAIKRAVRREFESANLIGPEQRAVRTKRLLTAVAERLVGGGREAAAAEDVVTATLSALGITVLPVRQDDDVDLTDSEARHDYFDDQKTQYLLYLGQPEITTIVEFCEEHWDNLSTIAAAEAQTGRDAKKKAREAAAKALEKSVVNELKRRLDGGKASDLALFGRMLADLPERNIDAASQVAHAISTHTVSSEFDYYTAVDDMKPEDTAGADMIGTIEFNSACYYRYANIDLDQLTANLGNDRELALATVRAFLVASRDAIPTGKQNSFAARNAPSFIMADVRPSGAWSLANAFVDPIAPTRDAGLIERSVEALDRHWGELVDLYEPRGVVTAFVRAGGGTLPRLGEPRQTFGDLVEATVAAAREA